MVGEVQGSASNSAVAEHEARTSPRMRVGDGNIASVARSDFEICVDTNARRSISNRMASVDVVKVGAGVDETVVTLRRGYKRGGSGGCGSGCGVGGGGCGGCGCGCGGCIGGCGGKFQSEALTTCLPAVA